MKLIHQELEARLITNWRKGERLDEDQTNKGAHGPVPVIVPHQDLYPELML